MKEYEPQLKYRIYQEDDIPSDDNLFSKVNYLRSSTPGLVEQLRLTVNSINNKKKDNRFREQRCSSMT